MVKIIDCSDAVKGTVNIKKIDVLFIYGKLVWYAHITLNGKRCECMQLDHIRSVGCV